MDQSCLLSRVGMHLMLFEDGTNSIFPRIMAMLLIGSTMLIGSED
jgi:hypothetical protein